MSTTTLSPERSPSKVQPMSDSAINQRLSAALEQYWGYNSFRPLQFDAMKCVMQDQDSLVVFPTGGGKSLCFQTPAMCRDGLAVVVSPLISLMKDQVDALQACGIPAACLNSSVSNAEQQEIWSRIDRGELRLLYLAPERLILSRTREQLQRAKVSFFAIDEAHCVSEWGHDFRPDYRSLSSLKQHFPGVAIHAYTATATQQVREDIVRQLGMGSAKVLVGSMDRSNLNYQLRRRSNGLNQIAQVIEQHKGESGIVYCISRKNVETTSGALNAMGYKTLPYHAGMSDEDRKANQEAFLQEKCDIVVATVAFGMGIDKSNVRYVIHASMPKSLEGYQQESGRAGRDGLEADCWMFYSGGDVVTWKRLLGQSDAGPGRDGALQSLEAMSNFCNGVQCRHEMLSAYFGQALESTDCGACDVCLGGVDLVEDPLIVGQKILSCVLRVEQRFGADYVSKVLIGSEDQRIVEKRHDRLSTFGLMSDTNKRSIRMWIDQLVSQSFLVKAGEYNVLQVTESGRQLLRGEITPKLTKPVEKQSAGASRTSTASWEGVDRGLFDQLKALRTKKSVERSVPAYVVFSDASLRDMARRRPSDVEAFRMVHGVAQKKVEDFADEFLAAIREYCVSGNVAQDVKPTPIAKTAPVAGPNASALAAFEHFEAGKSVAEVAKLMGRAESTTRGYLNHFIKSKQITDPSQWVDEATASRIREAVFEHGLGPLKPIFVALEEKVTYDEIRVVMSCMANEEAA